MSFQRALLVLIALAVVAGMAPAGVLLDRWLARALEDRARGDLAAAPRLLADRNQALGGMMVMHAKELAGTPRLASAVAANNRDAVRDVLAAGPTAAAGEGALVVGRDGSTWAGMAPTPDMIDSTRHGMMPVAVLAQGSTLREVALAPVLVGGVWVGAAGVTRPVDRGTAETLAGLSRSDVVLVAPGKAVAGATTSDSLAAAIAQGMPPVGDSVAPLRVGATRYLVAAAPLGPGATAFFVRNLDRELALVPRLRRVLAVSGLIALCIALLLGEILANRLTAPVRALANAADRLAGGEFDTPLQPFGVTEVRRLSQAFDDMRRSLAARLAELAERTQRLSSLQAELMQRDRLAATGHLVAQLAHEIRNPVANVRNCLELIRRRLGDDAEARGFADLAIEELMRMHALAEQLLDLNRPRDAAGAVSDPGVVVREVTALMGLDGSVDVTHVDNAHGVRASLGADALKQVLLNVARNAAEAMGPGGRLTLTTRAGRTGDMPVVIIDVSDEGPGIPDSILPRIFDPFVTTKTAVHGVGLGLYVAEGLVRTAGGRITAENRSPGPGAVFHIELPAVA